MTITYKLRFKMWRFRWLPENPSDRVRLTYTELDMCNGCAADLLLFAQGKWAGRG